MRNRHPRKKPREAEKAAHKARPVPHKRLLTETDKKKARYQKRRAEDVTAKDMLAANRTIAWFTGASVLVSVVFGVVSYLQWQSAETSNDLTRQTLEITRKASDAAVLQAKAATEQAGFADKSLRLQYQSTISVKEKLSFSPTPGEPGYARVEVENRGTLKVGLEASWRVIVTDGKSLDSDQQSKATVHTATLGDVAPRRTVYAFLPMDAIDKSAWRGALTDAKTIWIVGQIVATNEAGATTTGEFCWCSVSGTPYGWGACESR